MPTIKIKDSTHKILDEIFQNPEETIAAALKRNGYSNAYPCGGKGICGKCRYHVAEGEPVLSAEEENLLSKEELAGGVRLLCRSTFAGDGAIYLPEQEAKIESVGTVGRNGGWRIGVEARTAKRAEKILHGEVKQVEKIPTETAEQAEFDVAADIGTTTVAIALVSRQNGKVLAERTFNNSQREYGADVLSRIEAANAGHLEELQRFIWRDILQGIEGMRQDLGRNGNISRLAVSANTTMEHLFAGDSCEALGKAPFTPVSLELRKKHCRDIFPEAPKRYAEMEVIILPGISAFVGADIVSGMYELGMNESRKPVLLLDLGTNGEMALGAGEGFLATSTAAGPALEGGNISSGVPGVAGAICSLSMMGRRTLVHTIRNQSPIGLCGTGVLELAYEMRKMGIADEKGVFSEAYREMGFPVAQDENGQSILFTQQDMRQLQMAKAAIRSGMELLIKEAGLKASDIEKVYLAGGLGYKLNVYKAAGIGLIPPALKEKSVAVGNSSLSGALRYLKETDAAEKLEELRSKTKEMNLAAHPEFETNYYKNMNF